MKQFLASISMLAVLAAGTAAQADITIGVNLSSTGPAASLGIAEKNAISFGPSVIAGQKVHYVIYDDATDTTTAVQNVKRLVSENKVDVLIGPTTSPTSAAVIEAVAASKTPMIQLSPGPATISATDEKRKWIFSAPANTTIYGTAMINHMVKKGVKTVSVIAVDDAYGEVSTAAYKTLSEPKGIKTLTIEKYKRTDTSATAQVLHAMQGNPDAIFIASSGTPAALPHVALIERGYKGKIYQSGGAANAEFLRVGGKALEGSFMLAPPVVVGEQLPDGYPTKAEALKFIKAYEAKFGPRSMFASLAWDALKIVEAAVPKALKKGKPGSEKFRVALRDAIEGTKGLKGAGSVFSMSATDHSGVNQLGMSLMKVENGKWKLEDHAEFK
ncbi:MAG: ABC transporter substrate-binding protein [Desulfuromonadaceae bacterium]|nr:ABC transporter substrate-binding protein [Desulfuromonadaceae bacterium]